MTLFAAIANDVVALSGKASEVIEFVLGKNVAYAPLANEAGPIACGPQLRRISVCELAGGERFDEVANAVRALILTGEDGCSADSAYGGGHECIAEENALAGEIVDRGSLDDGIAGASKRVPALIVREEKNDVWPARSLK